MPFQTMMTKMLAVLLIASVMLAVVKETVGQNAAADAATTVAATTIAGNGVGGAGNDTNSMFKSAIICRYACVSACLSVCIFYTGCLQLLGPGNTENLMKFNCSSWKFLMYRLSMIDRNDIQS